MVLDGDLPANKTTDTKTAPCGLSSNTNTTLPTSDSSEHSSATPTEASTSVVVTDISANEVPRPVSVVIVPIQKSPRAVDLSRIATLEPKFELGYDSDGFDGPYCDMEALEGEQDYDEISLHADEDVDILDGIEIVSMVANDDGAVDDSITAGTKGHTEPIFVPIEEAILVKFSVAQLKTAKAEKSEGDGSEEEGVTRVVAKGAR